MSTRRMNEAGRRLLILLALIVVLSSGARSLLAQTRAGFILYEKYCATCHGTAANGGKLPDELKMRQMTSESIYEALTKPPHTTLPPSDEVKKRIAGHLGERKVGVAQIADARLMLNQCPVNPPLGNLSSTPIWNGWGVDLTNGRFQPAKEADLSADQVPRLKLKWAFGFPGVEEVYGQPTVAAGRVFLGVDTGAVYSLDAATGCVYWSFQADASVRTAISIKPIKKPESTTYGIYFGDLKANVYMLDAATGKQIWKVTSIPSPASPAHPPSIRIASTFRSRRSRNARRASAPYIPAARFAGVSSLSMPTREACCGRRMSFRTPPSPRERLRKASNNGARPAAPCGRRRRSTPSTMPSISGRATPTTSPRTRPPIPSWPLT